MNAKKGVIMKRIISMGLMIVITFGLSACELLIETEEPDTNTTPTPTIKESNNVPIISAFATNIMIDEGDYTAEMPSEAIITVEDTDDDNDKLTYTLQNRWYPFTIDPINGKVYATGTMNYERRPSYTLTIEVSDGEDSVTKELIINVSNPTPPTTTPTPTITPPPTIAPPTTTIPILRGLSIKATAGYRRETFFFSFTVYRKGIKIIDQPKAYFNYWYPSGE